MDSNEKTVRIVGVLFLLAMVASIIGFIFLQSVLNGSEYLSTLYPNKIKISFGVLFQLISDASVIGIGVLMFGIFKKKYDNIAVWILSTRLIEAVLLISGKIGLLLLIRISKEYIDAEAKDDSYFEMLGILANNWNAWSFSMAMIALGLGGMILSYLLYTARLVPRLISIIGVIGYAMMFAKSIADILGYQTGMIPFAGAAIFELIFPIWIIVKGFNPSPTISHLKD